MSVRLGIYLVSRGHQAPRNTETARHTSYVTTATKTTKNTKKSGFFLLVLLVAFVRFVTAVGPFTVDIPSGPLLHLIQELPEQVIRVVRPGRSFGVVLDAEHRLLFVPQPFDGAVVQIEVRHLHP